MASFVVKEGSSLGLRTPLRKSATSGFYAANTNILAQEKQNLMNLLMTNFGERPIHYDLGVNLDFLLFEQKTNFLRQKLADNITAALSKWLPHLKIRNLEIFFNAISIKVLPSPKSRKCLFGHLVLSNLA